MDTLEVLREGFTEVELEEFIECSTKPCGGCSVCTFD
jgi:hypothetical protein